MTNLQLTIENLRARYVTLDCSVLLLLIIGDLDKSHISKFNRTNAYTGEHFDILINLIKDSYLIVTPNVLTEASDLLENYSNKFRNNQVFPKLKDFIMAIKENYFKSSDLVHSGSFMKFGLADSSVFQLCRDGAIAITTDGDLYSYLINSECSAINFNHVIVNLN